MVLFAAAFFLGRSSRERQIGRTVWTHAWCWLVIHVVCAFHFYHGWNHEVALADTARRTAERIGWAFAGGLYFNYVFLALWGFEICWWWIAPSTYSKRSPLITRSIQGFLIFIVFQATVVFAHGPTQWISALLFLLMGANAMRIWWRRKSSS